MEVSYNLHWIDKDGTSRGHNTNLYSKYGGGLYVKQLTEANPDRVFWLEEVEEAKIWR